MKRYESNLLKVLAENEKAFDKYKACHESAQEAYTTAVEHFINDGKDFDSNMIVNAAHELRTKNLTLKDGKEILDDEGKKLFKKMRVRLERACEALKESHNLEKSFGLKYTKDRGYHLEERDFKEVNKDDLIELIKQFKANPLDLDLKEAVVNAINDLQYAAIEEHEKAEAAARKAA